MRGSQSPMMQITNRDELEAWLENKPRDWSVAIAHRCALRVAPFALYPAYFALGTPHKDLIREVPRATLISAAARYVPAAEMKTAAYVSDFVALSATDVATRTATLAADAAAYAAARAADAAARTATLAADAAARTAGAAARAAAGAAADAATIWRSVTLDVEFLDSNNSHEALLSRPLWPNAVPGEIAAEIDAMRKTLRKSPDGYGYFQDWYERRLAGRDTGFALPPAQDEEMYRRIVAQEGDWWLREPAEVNADIQSWLDELTSDKEAAQLETIETRLEIGIKPDFAAPGAELPFVDARQSVAAARSILHDMLPAQIGHNNPPEDARIDLHAEAPVTQADLVRIEQTLARLEEKLDQPKPDVPEIAKETGWFKRQLDKLREHSPEFMKGLEKTLGENTGRAITWGIALLIGSLTGVLQELLNFLLLVLK